MFDKRGHFNSRLYKEIPKDTDLHTVILRMQNRVDDLPEPESTDVTKVFKKTESDILKRKAIRLIRYPNLGGLLAKSRYFKNNSEEIFSRVLCEFIKNMDHYEGFVFYPNELPAYGIAASEILEAQKISGASESDLICLIADGTGTIELAEMRFCSMFSWLLRGYPKTSFISDANKGKFYFDINVKGEFDYKEDQAKWLKERIYRMATMEDEGAFNLLGAADNINTPYEIIEYLKDRRYCVHLARAFMKNPYHSRWNREGKPESIPIYHNPKNECEYLHPIQYLQFREPGTK